MEFGDSKWRQNGKNKFEMKGTDQAVVATVTRDKKTGKWLALIIEAKGKSSSAKAQLDGKVCDSQEQAMAYIKENL